MRRTRNGKLASNILGTHRHSVAIEQRIQKSDRRWDAVRDQISREIDDVLLKKLGVVGTMLFEPPTDEVASVRVVTRPQAIDFIVACSGLKIRNPQEYVRSANLAHLRHLYILAASNICREADAQSMPDLECLRFAWRVARQR